MSRKRIAHCHPDRPHKANGFCLQCYTKSQPRREYYRKEHLWRTYRLTETNYQVMLIKQHGLCAICLQPPLGNSRRLYVDHDHKTNKVRGLLCATCNTFIGKTKEDFILLQRASAYLEQFVQNSFSGSVRFVDLPAK
jgi:hypothetical protein